MESKPHLAGGHEFKPHHMFIPNALSHVQSPKETLGDSFACKPVCLSKCRYEAERKEGY